MGNFLKKFFKDSSVEDNERVTSEALKADVHYVRKRGSGHIAEDKPCQDACLCKNIYNKVIVNVVADGHGGEKYIYSEFGSKLACDAVADVVRECIDLYGEEYAEENFINYLLTDSFKKLIIDNWRNKVKRDFQGRCKEQLDDREIIGKYGTTLLFCVVTEHFYILGQLGDGAILLFNDGKYYQYFKRRAIKYDSVTASMSSSKCLESFITGFYRRGYFDHVLLSTDGIYDRIDQGDTFYYYGQSLAKQVKEFGGLKKPFTLGGEFNPRKHDIDISELKNCTDDCTIMLISSKGEFSSLPFSRLQKYGFANVKFFRAYDGMISLLAEKDSKEYFLHLGKGKPSCLLDGKVDNIFQHEGIYELNNSLYAISYPRNNELVEISELYEQGELKENYNSNIYQTNGSSMEINNILILKCYENLVSLSEMIKEKNLSLSKNFASTVMVDNKGNVYAYDDMVSYSTDLSDIEKKKGRDRLQALKSRFNLLGVLISNELRYPLFRTNTIGGVICYPHSAEKDMKMMQIKLSTKGEYGAINISEDSWEIVGEGKCLDKGKGLAIKQDREFRVPCKGRIFCEADVREKYVYYRFKLYDL